MTVLNEWVVEPVILLPMSTGLMLYYKEHFGERFYRAFNHAQTYLAVMQDQGAVLVANDYEAWLPSQRDTSIIHTVSDDSCTCEGFQFNQFCVHMAVRDCLMAVMGGKEVRRV